MHDRRFDDLTRRLGASTHKRTSRRALLRAAGIGVAAGALSKSHTTATPNRQGPFSRPPGGRSIEQIAFDLDYDPGAIFRFVRDEIRYDPYAGALRGATGTLWGLAGNAVDQSLLLAALLERSLVRTRFAIGTLDDEATATLLATAELDLTAAQDHVARVHRLGQPDDASTPALTADQQQFVETITTEGERRSSIAPAFLAEDLAVITNGLAAAGVSPPLPAFTLPDRERTQHVWIQYAAGPVWIDLDPTLPAAEPGQTFVTATETLADLPDDLEHIVVFRAVAEKIAAGQPTRTDLLTYQARSRDLTGLPLTFLHLKPDALKAVGITTADLLEGTTQYIPHLALGADAVVAGTDRITLATGGGLGEVFGGGSTEGDTLAEWLEIEILSPDAPPRQIVREIFDRVGFDRRAAGDPIDNLPPAALTDLGANGGQVFLPLERISSIVVAGGEVPLGYLQQDYARGDLYSDLGVIGHSYHVARDTLSFIANGETGYRFFADGPNLTAFTLALSDVAGDQARGASTIDLLHQRIAAVPLTGAQTAGHPLVAAGALSHSVERMLFSPSSEAARLRPVASVGQVFEAAASASIPIRTLLPGVSPAPELAVSARAQALIAEALAAGYVVIVPERAVSVNGADLVGWWQVDPATGTTFDQMETGQGVEGADYAVTLQPSVEAVEAYRQLAFCTTVLYCIVTIIVFSYLTAWASGASLLLGNRSAAETLGLLAATTAGAGLGPTATGAYVGCF